MTVTLLAVIVELYIQLFSTPYRAHVLEDWPDITHGSFDYLIIGDSRSSQHIITNQLNKQIGWDGINLGFDGYKSWMGQHRMQHYVKHCQTKPKFILLQLDYSFARAPGKHSHIYSRDGNIKFWFLDQLDINQYYKSYSDWSELDAWIPLFRYRSSPLMLCKHLLLSNRYDKKNELGFWNPALSGTMKFFFPKKTRKDLEFHNIFKFAADQNVRIIFFTPPSPENFHSPSNHSLDSLFQANNLEKVEHIAFWNWREFSFRDEAHLTFESSIQFTRALGDSLLKLGLETIE